MLTLEQAIAHCEEKARENRKKADEWYAGGCSFAQAEGNDCLECAKDHEQLAEWLKELRVYRETDNGDTISREDLLKQIDKEREYLKARGLFGAEHILVHNFRELVEKAQPVVPSKIYKAGYHAGFYAVHGEP